jgi:hypothetical protein
MDAASLAWNSAIPSYGAYAFAKVNGVHIHIVVRDTNHASFVDKGSDSLTMRCIRMKLGISQDIHPGVLRSKSEICVYGLPVLVGLLLAERIVDLKQDHEAKVRLLIAMSRDASRFLMRRIELLESVLVGAFAYQAVRQIGRRTYA